jgi:VanZ family protein
LVTLIKEALTERASQGRRVSMPALLAVLATAFVGPLDESIQTFLPTRFFDYRDVLLNVLAALMAIAASMVLACARQWRSQG